MRNPSTLGYEGAANLLEGFRVAADPASRGRGVMVVLNDEINAAREVTKTDALRLQTFQTRGYGVLGVVDRDRVVYYRRVERRHTADSEFDVAAMTAAAARRRPADLSGRERRLDPGGGRRRRARGSSSPPPAPARRAAPRARACATRRPRVFRSSSPRAPAAAGSPAAAAGTTIAGEDLAPIKARILLMVALDEDEGRQTSCDGSSRSTDASQLPTANFQLPTSNFQILQPLGSW